MNPATLAISSRIWETAGILFLAIPLTLLWAGSLIDILLRKDLAIPRKAPWFAVVLLFPLVGTLIYALRRPGWTERATSLRHERPLLESQQQAVESLENFAITLDLARTTLKQSSELLHQMTILLSDAGSTAGFALPLTRIRPLRPVEARVRKLTDQVRELGFTMETMAAALGTNSGDLHSLARRLDWQQNTAEAVEDEKLATAPEPVGDQAAVQASIDVPSRKPETVRIPVRGTTAPDGRAGASVQPVEDGTSPELLSERAPVS